MDDHTRQKNKILIPAANMRSTYFLIIATILLLPAIAGASSTATIHGVAYEWNTFQPLENTIIEVNSTPSQSYVARYGMYSFDLAAGDYMITASYYENDSPVYTTQETVTIIDEGDYILDLLLLPIYPEEASNENMLSDIGSLEKELEQSDENEPISAGTYLFATGLIALILFGAYSFSKKANKPDSSMEDDQVLEDQDNSLFQENPPIDEIAEKQKDIPEELQEILDIIISSGGRITQKDLRSKLKYSEGKVSLMVSDLENRGFVEKFRKGRGNVIVLLDSK